VAAAQPRSRATTRTGPVVIWPDGEQRPAGGGEDREVLVKASQQQEAGHLGRGRGEGQRPAEQRRAARGRYQDRGPGAVEKIKLRQVKHDPCRLGCKGAK
jgi:hypothetical protein